MTHFIAVIDKDERSCFGVWLRDWPGVTAAGDTLDEALAEAANAIAFAAEDWRELTGHALPEPRSIDELRRDPEFVAHSEGAILAVVPLRQPVVAA